jgi:signal transduction histidine kinase
MPLGVCDPLLRMYVTRLPQLFLSAPYARMAQVSTVSWYAGSQLWQRASLGGFNPTEPQLCFKRDPNLEQLARTPLASCLQRWTSAQARQYGGNRLMSGISQRRFYSTIKKPSSEALDLLAAYSGEISETWKRALRQLNLEPNDLLPEVPLDFARVADRLRQSTYPGFRQWTQEFGEALARRGVRLDHAVAALNRLFEICIPRLIDGAPKRATPVLALARLHALVGLLIVSGYTGQWAAGKKTLVEASLLEAEDRRHGASAYVTRIYEQERRRLSQDLHDEVGHDLMLLKLYLEMIALDDGSAKVGEIMPRIAEAIALVSHTIDSVRRLVLDLGPAVFEDLGFVPAVRSYISRFSARSKIKVTLKEGYLPTEVPSSHQVALYRLLQGALSNVLKHAKAKNVKVSLGSMKDSVLIMVIEDDGVGFDTTERAGRRSFGLTAMRERVEVLGGRIHLQSKTASRVAKDHGTRIEVDLPLPGGQE